MVQDLSRSGRQGRNGRAERSLGSQALLVGCPAVLCCDGELRLEGKGGDEERSAKVPSLSQAQPTTTAPHQLQSHAASQLRYTE